MTPEQVKYRRELLGNKFKPNLNMIMGHKKNPKPAELLVLLGEMEYARIEIPDYECQPFEARVKIKEALVKDHITRVMKVLGTGKRVSFVIIAQSKMNLTSTI